MQNGDMRFRSGGELEEATNQEWTEVRHAKNKQTVSNIQEYLAMTIAAHTRFGTNKYTAAKAVANHALYRVSREHGSERSSARSWAQILGSDQLQVNETRELAA